MPFINKLIDLILSLVNQQPENNNNNNGEDMANYNDKVTANFRISEFLVSETADKLGCNDEQENPSQDVVDSLTHLIKNTLQPAREFLGASMNITSGYRCKTVNDHVGSTDRSQHLKGEAADFKLSSRFLTSSMRSTLDDMIEANCGKRPRSDVNASYYAWAYMVLFMETLDIDQIIHEYGEDGKPSWIHVAASDRQDRRRITIKRYREPYTSISAKEALLLGC